MTTVRSFEMSFTASRAIAHIQNNAPRRLHAPIQSLDRCTVFTQTLADTDYVQRCKPNRLEDQARTKRRGHFHPVVDHDTLALACEQCCTRKPCDPASRDGYLTSRHARPCPDIAMHYVVFG